MKYCTNKIPILKLFQFDDGILYQPVDGSGRGRYTPSYPASAACPAGRSCVNFLDLGIEQHGSDPAGRHPVLCRAQTLACETVRAYRAPGSPGGGSGGKVSATCDTLWGQCQLAFRHLHHMMFRNSP